MSDTSKRAKPAKGKAGGGKQAPAKAADAAPPAKAPAKASPAKAAPPRREDKTVGASTLLLLALLVAVFGGAAFATWPFWSPYLARYIPALESEPFQDPRIDGVADRVKALEGVMENRTNDINAIQDLVSQRDRFSERLKVLMKRVVDLEKALQSVRKMVQATAPPSQSQAAGANQSLQQLSERFAKLEESGEAVENLLQRISQLEKSRAALGENIAAETSQISGALDGISERVGALERTGSLIDKRIAGAPATVVAIGQLREALRGPAPFARELQELREAAGDDPSMENILSRLDPYADSGIPPLASLRGRFDEVAGKIAGAAMTREGDGWFERALNRLSSLVTVRRTGDSAPADSADSVLARAETGLKKGDLMAAVKALEGLDGSSAEAAAPWLAGARSRLAAEKAMASLHVIAISLLTNVKE